MPDSVFLIDTFSLMFQVFHAIPPMSSPSGMPTNAVFGFSRDLVSLLQTHKPAWLICAMESPGIGVREELYPEYKAHRAEMPEDLRPQIPLLVEVIEAFQIPIVQSSGWEADDVIATLTRQAVARGLDVRIVTSDKDARQLLGPQVKMYNLRKNLYLDESALLADWGVRPDQVVDFQSLVGDAVDNVPGVPLVGPKKAAALLQQFQTLEGVLQNADLAPGAKLKENLKRFADQARLSQMLVRLNQELPLEFDWEASRQIVPNVPALQELFRKLGFRRLIDDVKQFAPKTVAPSQAPIRSERTLFDDDRTQQVSVEIVSDAVIEIASANGPEFSESSGVLSEIGQGPWTDGNSASRSNPNVRSRQWTIVDTAESLEVFLEAFRQQTRFCVDLETTSLDPRSAMIVGWAVCWQPGNSYYLPTLGPEGSQLLNGLDVLEAMKPILQNPAIKFVNQNVKFDLMVLASHGIDISPDCIDVDPMVGDYLLDAGARSHSLETLITNYLHQPCIGIEELIGTGKKQRSMMEVPIDKVAEYATEDADLTLQLADMISTKLKSEGLWPLYQELERPLIPILAEMEQTGIKVNTDELRSQSSELSNRLQELMAEIYRIAGHEFNIDSPKQLQVVLFEELGLPVQKKTKTGASTDQEVLEELAKLHQLPARIIEHRHLSKLKGTYLDALPQLVHPRTGRIHTSFNQVVAATGRLSSSDPNLQNIPIRTPEGERIRRAFVASSSLMDTSRSRSNVSPSGQRGLFDDVVEHEVSTLARAVNLNEMDGETPWRLVCADYSQIELRVLAHFSRDPELIRAFENGIDIHSAVASQVFGVEQDAVTSTQRRIAKAVNFGVIYGQSAFGLAAALGIEKEEAAKFIDGYFAKYSGVSQFIEETLEAVRQRGFATTILGRRRPIDGIRADRTRNLNMPERTAVNSVIQGSAADLIKRAMLAVDRRMKLDRHPGRMLLQIHDELVFESPVTSVSSLVDIVRAEMQNAMSLSVPLVVDVSTGVNWQDTEPM